MAKKQMTTEGQYDGKVHTGTRTHQPDLVNLQVERAGHLSDCWLTEEQTEELIANIRECLKP